MGGSLQDIDKYKNFIPDNCADKDSINQCMKTSPYRLKIKILTSQFNTTSQKIEEQFRHQDFIKSLGSFQYNELKIQLYKILKSKMVCQYNLKVVTRLQYPIQCYLKYMIANNKFRIQIM
ncbi:hypothetical protein ABPG72_007394 [Tetrahymena utriculariae]